MAPPAFGYEDGPDIPVPRLVLHKLVTRSHRLEEFEQRNAAQFLIDREREMVDHALSDLRAVMSERGMDWTTEM